jgi:hypothetical protein
MTVREWMERKVSKQVRDAPGQQCILLDSLRK